MIRFYWPKKAVPEWLEKIEMRNEVGPHKIHHDGFGVIIKFAGVFHVFGLTGNFILVSHCRDVTFHGQGNGVHYHNLLHIGCWTTQGEQSHD